METMLWYYAFGKPTETIDIHGELGVVLQKLGELSTMSDDALVVFLEEVEQYARHG